MEHNRRRVIVLFVTRSSPYGALQGDAADEMSTATLNTKFGKVWFSATFWWRVPISASIGVTNGPQALAGQLLPFAHGVLAIASSRTHSRCSSTPYYVR